MTTIEDRAKLRTWLCSVVFVDIVKYSTQSVDVQMTWKGRFNGYLAEAIRELAAADRVILDTGDGAAICFLGDPEAAMFATLRLLDALVCEEPKCDAGPMRVRIGINLGSVKLLKDINGNLNAVGDGINVAQRVMSFAGENQVLVSRSFYEVVSCLSDAYQQMFRYNGVRKDKHVREHTVYDLQPPGAVGGAARAEVIEVAPPVVAAAPAPVLDAAVIGRVEAALTAIVGPIAGRLVRNASGRAGTLAELVAAVAPFIPGEADRAGFVGAFAGGGAAVAPAAAATAVPEPASAVAWDPAVLERARTALAVYVGPMARVIVNRAAAKARTLKQLYDLLAAEIPAAEERERFRAAKG